MQPHEIALRRMRTQRLWGRGFDTIEDPLRWLTAMQSQEYPVAKWSIGQRARALSTDADLERAFAQGSILRTHVLRPTWHFVLPEDIRWLLALTGPRVHATNRAVYRGQGLDDELLAKTDRLLARALAAGRHLTRFELAAALERAGIPANGIRLAYIVMHAELNAIVCSGPRRGRQHTYALVEERAPTARTLDREEALAELTRRFFTAHGPATVKDFSWWSSLTVGDIRRGLEMVGVALHSQTIDGRTYWFDRSTANAARSTGRIDLVQGYDECIVSYTESKDVLRGPWVEAFRGDRTPLLHAILLDGRLLGHWQPVTRGSSTVLRTFTYRPPDQGEERELEAAADRFSRFTGSRIALG